MNSHKLFFNNWLVKNNATQQPLETLAAQSIVSNLPPTPDNAPVEIQEELLQMQIWDLEELLAIGEADTLRVYRQQSNHLGAAKTSHRIIGEK
ncbi:MAG: hypothetical protein VKN72_27055 [Nostocales cyanobacterium 94392]|nr:hypothetical protein [Nostocales cyanobacterium 94392]